MGLVEGLLMFFVAYPFSVSFAGAFFGGEETILALAFLSGQDMVPVWSVFLACLLGTFSSDSMWFFFGRSRLMTRALAWRWVARAYKEVDRLYVSLTRYGTFLALLIGKFIYGTRIATIAYLSRERMTFKRFSAFNAAIIAVWSGIVISVGWLAGRGFSKAINVFQDVEKGVFLLFLFLLAMYLLKRGIDRFLRKELRV